jgi:O-glycosyl hydrolase
MQIMKKLFFALLAAFAVFFVTACLLEVVYFDDAVKPEITGQPQSASYVLGDDLTIAPLTVTVSKPSDDGELTYQWFSFTRDAEYLSSTGTRLEGETTTSYTPPPEDFAEEGIHGYYVVITNANKKTVGRERTSVKSSAAVIAVTEPKNAKYPVITQQPKFSPDRSDNVFILSRSLSINISVSAEVSEERDILSFEWYKAESFTNENGTPLGVYSPGFSPDITGEGDGTYWYFVLVTNTNYTYTGRQVSSIASHPIEVVVIRNPDAAVPEITAHPQGRIYFLNENVPVAALKVEADRDDDGTLSLQWYSNTTASNTGGTEITGETGTTYQPPASILSRAGRYYYYVVVTNDNPKATRTKTATVTSKVAILTVQDRTVPAANATLTVNMNEKFQYVRGFGGMDVAWGGFPSYSMADYERMFNPDELGYNVLRIMILPNYTDINRTMAELVENKLSGNEDRSNYYNFVRVVNKYNGYVLASPWTPPKEWKNNNSIVGNGTNPTLRVSNYPDFGNYLREFCRNMYNNGAPIYVVSTQNEPTYPSEYDGCTWSAAQNLAFFQRVGRFTEGVPGYGGGRVTPTVLIMDGESHNEVNRFHEALLRNQTARASFDIVGRHTYGATSDSTQAYYPMASNPMSVTDGDWTPAPNANWPTDAHAKEVWMTEKNINSTNDIARLSDSTWNYLWVLMNDIDFTIRHSRENAYIWWSLKRFYSMLGDNTLGTVNSAVMPRGHGLSHFAKFAKETGRVGFTVAGTLADGTVINTMGGNNSHINAAPGAGTAEEPNRAPNQIRSAKITAYVTLRDGIDVPVRPDLGYAASAWNFGRNSLGVDDITAISLVMYTPTGTAGTDGYNLGTIEIALPAGFTIANAEAMRSDRNAQSVMEQVVISADRTKAYVTLPASNVLSVRLIKQ